MIHQLYHVGQHGDADNSFAPSWSPSGLPSYHDSDGSHAMTEAEIEELIDSFVHAAVRAQAAGFDGVELFAAYHAVIDQFWTPWSNRRTDRWGGSLEDRMRFSSTLLRRIRDACGDDFIVGLAVNRRPGIGRRRCRWSELQEIVAWHDERALMDYVTCGTGSYFDFFTIIPPSLYPPRLGEPYAAALKAVTSHAVVQAESHIRTPEAAEEVLAAGHADLVSIVRGQIADPHLVAKARSGPRGPGPAVHLLQPAVLGTPLRGLLDLVPRSTRRPGGSTSGAAIAFEPAERPRTVLVVGGGPAGLEAARVAAERGHAVVLVRGDARRLGGQWLLAGRQPTRGADPRSPRVVRAGAGPPRGGRAAGHGGDGRVDRRPSSADRRRRRHRSAAGRCRLPAGACRWSTACPASTTPNGDEHPRRAGGRRWHRRAVSSCSTTSATGGASGRRCTCRRPAARSRW